MISKNEIKFLKSLNLLKFRAKYNLFKVEGWRSVKEFLNSDYNLVSFIATSDWLEKNDVSLKNIKIIKENDLKFISSLKNPNQIIAVFEKKHMSLNYKELTKNVHIFLENITNPGNLGSIIRTCDWFGIKNIICSNDSVDIYNPKVIQSSMGSLSRVTVSYVNKDVFFSHLTKNNIHSLVADLTGQNIYDQKKISNGIICFGNESIGVSKKLQEIASQKITIPSFNKKCESLNLSVSFGIIVSQILGKK